MIHIVDYNMGNLHSVATALTFLGAQFFITSNPKEIAKANCIILPGVGSFAQAMHNLHQAGLDTAIKHAVLECGAKIFGICLGMQLFAMQGFEDGKTQGLGFIPAQVIPIQSTASKYALTEIIKVPHMGFNQVKSQRPLRLFAGLNDGFDCYFVHSFHLELISVPSKAAIATTYHGIELVAAYENDRIFATQFHPEKSQGVGLQILKNFLRQNNI